MRDPPRDLVEHSPSSWPVSGSQKRAAAKPATPREKGFCALRTLQPEANAQSCRLLWASTRKRTGRVSCKNWREEFQYSMNKRILMAKIGVCPSQLAT